MKINSIERMRIENELLSLFAKTLGQYMKAMGYYILPSMTELDITRNELRIRNKTKSVLEEEAKKIIAIVDAAGYEQTVEKTAGQILITVFK